MGSQRLPHLSSEKPPMLPACTPRPPERHPGAVHSQPRVRSVLTLNRPPPQLARPTACSCPAVLSAPTRPSRPPSRPGSRSGGRSAGPSAHTSHRGCTPAAVIPGLSSSPPCRNHSPFLWPMTSTSAPEALHDPRPAPRLDLPPSPSPREPAHHRPALGPAQQTD